MTTELSNNSLLSLKSSIEKLYPKHEFEWKESQSGITGLCPMHDDKHRSFSLFISNTGKPMYKCFGCGGTIANIKGTGEPSFTINDLKEIEHSNLLNPKYATALDYIKDRVMLRQNGNVTDLFKIEQVRNELVPAFIKATPTLKILSQEIADYFIKKFPNHKNISKIKTLNNYIGWIAFFYNDANGNITQVKVRQPHTKKIFTITLQDNSNPSAFLMPTINKRPDRHIVYVVEGEFDAIVPEVLLMSENTHFVASGTISKIIEISNYIDKMGFITILSPDNDQAGNKIKSLDSLKTIHSTIGLTEYNEEYKDFGELFCDMTQKAAIEILKSIHINKRDTLIQKIKTLSIDSDIDYINTLQPDIAELYADKMGIKIQDIAIANKFKSVFNLPEIKQSGKVDVFGFNVEYGAICILAGSTGTGKTEFTMEIANVHARQENSISLLCYFEGNEKHIQTRLKSKGINNPELYYAIKPNFAEIKKMVLQNKDKKVFLVIDYIQKLARHLRVVDNKATEQLMTYIDRIFEFFDDLRNEFPNICICLLASYSKQGINEMKAERLPDMVTIANSIKESGDIAYDVDYGYSIHFATQEEKERDQWSIGRKIKGVMRNYMLLYGFKDSRIHGELNENVYVFDPETRLYNLVEQKNINNGKQNRNISSIFGQN